MVLVEGRSGQDGGTRGRVWVGDGVGNVSGMTDEADDNVGLLRAY